MTGHRRGQASATDALIRWGAIAAVLAVAGIAAVLSYGHIVSLAERWGHPAAAARMLPLSVDGLIAAASLVLLLEARAGRSEAYLPQFALVLGVLPP